MTPPQFTLQPFWLGYAVALAVCVGWAWRLSREATKRDAETDARDADIPREAALWITVTDAVTDVAITISSTHIVAVREAKNAKAYVVTSNGVEYHVNESRAAILQALTEAAR